MVGRRKVVRTAKMETSKRLKFKYVDGHFTAAQDVKENKILSLMEKFSEKKAAYLSSIDTTMGIAYPHVQQWVIDKDEYPSHSFSGYRQYEYKHLLEILEGCEGFEILSINQNNCGLPKESGEEIDKGYDHVDDGEGPLALGGSDSNEKMEDFKYVESMVAKVKFENKDYLVKLSIELREDCYFVETGEHVFNEGFNISCKTTVQLIHSQKDKDDAEKLMDTFKSSRVMVLDSKKSTINIVIHTNNGYDLVSYEIKKPEMDFNMNYNDDFTPEYDKILERLNTPKDKGIVMFHGEPGTGKTTLIKYLLSVVKKKVIYIPPDLAPTISRPEFIAFLMQHSNSILVIEDAENAIISRDQAGGGSQQAVANLLNLSDGILSDALSIQIVCTFNADINKIDNALLRKGRLISKYEFKSLEKEKAKKLASKLGHDPDKVTDDIRLCEIYALGEKTYEQKEETAGFQH